MLERDFGPKPAGAVIAGRAMRRSRWSIAENGRRGGARVIYYHVAARARIRMIPIYRKGIKVDLTPKDAAGKWSLFE
jgi:hypothetical protein